VVRRSLVALLAVAAFPSSAVAAPVVVLGHDGRSTVRNDPFVTGPAMTPAPGPGGSAGVGGSGGSAGRAVTARAASTPKPGRKPRRRPGPTVLSELARLYHAQLIDQAGYRGYVGQYDSALATEKRLTGTRRAQLTAVTVTMHEIAAAHHLSVSRLPALFATLAANQRWWTTGPLLSYGQRVEFAGSQLVWEYYPGQGIQLTMLGNFGKADGLYTAGPSQYPAMEQLLSELIPLAARRAGGLAWEYYFSFDGGVAPWTSAMSQATALEALSRAFVATGNAAYLTVAAQAVPLFAADPPTGVAVPTSAGTRYLQYTFAPGTSIINAFLQTLIGIDTYATVSGNPVAQHLFAAGNAEAMAEVPQFDTGAWSLYQPGVEDDLSYHQLVTGFLAQLCTLTAEPVYCTTAQHFQADLTTPPVLTQLTLRDRAPRKALPLRFQLSKRSRVGLTVTNAGGQTVYASSASFPYGANDFTVPPLQRTGDYGVVLTAIDLAGNDARIAGVLSVTR
jgi:hypothetical protein